MKYTIFFLVIFFFGAFLRLYQLPSQTPFIGDQGWFYISARDMLISHNFPLVGITSSHTWLHQGPYWTYLLAIAFFISKFNPFSPVMLSVSIDLLTLILVYYIGKKMFAQNFALIAQALYAFSPLTIFYARFAYHTNPIPLFSLILLYVLYIFINGNKKAFIFILPVLGILYNFELAATIFFGLVILIFAYGYLKKKLWIRIPKKIFLQSFLLFLLVMLPILIYDVSHNFIQTIGFLGWIFYTFLKGIVGIFGLGQQSFTLIPIITFYSFLIQKLLFLPQMLIGISIFILSLLVLCIKVYKNREKKIQTQEILLLLFFFLPCVGIILSKTPSEAYFPMVLPSIIFIVAYMFYFLFTRQKLYIILLIVCFLSNIVFLIQHNYLVGVDYGNAPSYDDRLRVAKDIVAKSAGKQYNLLAKGEGAEFDSATANYAYLTWWLGNGPSKKKEKTVFIISENARKLTLEKKTYD